MSTETKEAKKDNKPAVVEKTIVDNVLNRVKQFESLGQLTLPKDYNAANALRAAYLVLLETTNKEKKPVLEVCTQTSVANALLKMVTEGLLVAKRQGSFIAYGTKLTFQREYAGTVALAKRFGKVVDVVANVIYDKDVFKYSIDGNTGRRSIVEHTQEFENIDEAKIKGAYATVVFEDGTTNVEIMTMAQIKAAWAMGQQKGQGDVHKNFPSEMSKKTVIARACKLVINSSNDASVMEEDIETDQPLTASRQTIAENANTEEVTFDEHEEVQENEAKEEQPQDQQAEPEKRKPGF